MNVEFRRFQDRGAAVDGGFQGLHGGNVPLLTEGAFGPIEDLHDRAEVDGGGHGVIFEDAAEAHARPGQKV